MATAILQAILILFILAFAAGLVFQALAFLLATRRRDRARAIPQGHWGHWADRVTAQDIRRANWAADRDAQGVKDFQRAQILAGGCHMLTPENRMKGMRNLAGILESTIAIIRGTIANLELDADCGPDFNGEFRRSEFGVYEVALHDFSNTAEYPDGFYLLETDRNDERCLVRLYTPIEPKVRGVGFGIWDGGGFMPLAELVRDARLTRVVFMTRGGASC